MDNGREEAGWRNSSLRRVAIVLSSLPEPVAARLLGNFTPEARGRLHHARRSLAEVEPWERQLALQSFSGSIKQHQGPSAPAAGVEDEATFSRNATQASTAASHPPWPHAEADRQDNWGRSKGDGDASPQSSTAGDPQPSPLAFLHAVPDASLVGLLAGEHPQTIALVLASIDPAQAARILPQLHPVQRQDAISRIGRLGEIPAEAVSDIAEHLRSRVSPDANVKSQSSGQRVLSAIFAQLSQPIAGSRNDDRQDDSAFQQIQRLRRLRDELDAQGDASRSRADAHRSRADGADASSQQATNASAEIDPAASDASLAEIAADRDSVSIGPNSSSESDGSTQTTSAAQGNEWLSTDDVHQHLTTLSPADLCQALAKVQTRQALLTLCGLPNEVAEAVLKMLPRSQGKTVRRQLASLGPLRLREIDQAKEVVARVSWGEPLDADSSQEANDSAPSPRPAASHHQPVAA